MMTTGTRLLAAGVTMVALLGLGACSSDDSDGADGPTTTAVADDASTTAGDGETTTTRMPGTGGDDGTTGGVIERYADYETVNYDDPTHWVCRPDLEDDICHGDLDTTVIEADGSTTVEPFEAAENPLIDCFYVYPTISRDETKNSDWNASPEEEGYVTLQQAARLRSVCRVFAPVYRQNTLTSLTTSLGGGEVAEPEEPIDAYADVLDAFRTYMAEDNDGRGVVLIGHSQGAGMLNRLIAEEVDPNADVRELLVSAYLAGGSVAVPEGEVVGGDFQDVPLCTSDTEFGCVVTWATFRDTAPPPASSYFGRPRDGGGVSGCVNPAGIGGGDVPLHGYYPSDRTASILSSLGAGGESGAWVEGSTAAIDTPFVSLPGLVTGQCASTDGFTYLSITVHPDPGARVDDISGDLTPEWGLHLVDVNLVMGDVVARVADQARTWAG